VKKLLAASVIGSLLLVGCTGSTTTGKTPAGTHTGDSGKGTGGGGDEDGPKPITNIPTPNKGTKKETPPKGETPPKVEATPKGGPPKKPADDKEK
jgi:hypothetical protein